MSVPVTRKVIELKDGVLELTIIAGGRLALGQLTSGQASSEDLIKQLSAAGVRAGYYDQGLAMISKGIHDKVPVAAARVLSSPGRSTMPRKMANIPAVQEDWDKWTAPKLDGKVEEGDLVIQVEDPPVTSIQNVSGEREELSRAADRDARQFVGAGTRSSDDNTSVLADRSGYAFRTLFGEARVLEAEEIQAFSRSLGKYHWEGSLSVGNDIREGSRAKIDGTLVVEGNVSGASLEAKGNVHIEGRADNANHGGSAFISAGQSLRVKDLKETKVWAGEDIYVTRSVEKCQIQCLGKFVARHINGGEVRVGERLVAETVTGGTSVYLGTRHIDIHDLESKKSYYNQHMTMLGDIHLNLHEHQQAYTRARDSMVHEIQRINQRGLSAPQRSRAAQVLLRQFTTMNETLETFKKYLNNYIEMASKTERQLEQINYYQHRLEDTPRPEAIITGRLELGTTFFGPAGRLEIEEEVSAVCVRPDPITGELVIHPL